MLIERQVSFVSGRNPTIPTKPRARGTLEKSVVGQDMTLAGRPILRSRNDRYGPHHLPDHGCELVAGWQFDHGALRFRICWQHRGRRSRLGHCRPAVAAPRIFIAASSRKSWPPSSAPSFACSCGCLHMANDVRQPLPEVRHCALLPAPLGVGRLEIWPRRRREPARLSKHFTHA
jgi:hypothetical protein